VWSGWAVVRSGERGRARPATACAPTLPMLATILNAPCIALAPFCAAATCGRPPWSATATGGQVVFDRRCILHSSFVIHHVRRISLISQGAESTAGGCGGKGFRAFAPWQPPGWHGTRALLAGTAPSCRCQRQPCCQIFCPPFCRSRLDLGGLHQAIR
jgi:hypothetical protein